MIVAKRWAFTTFLITMLRPARFQFPMPMYPAPIYVMPPPPPIQVAVMPVMMTTSKSTTTSTTTEQNIAIAYPVPVPYPMPVPMPQIAVPAMSPPQFCMGTDGNKDRPKNCPPCPPCLCMPSCTPAFFSYCSPCHQQCRCRSKEDVPVPQPPVAPMPMPGPAYPMPMPMPMRPPIILAPFPPFPVRHKPAKSECDSSVRRTSDSTSSSESSSNSGGCSSSDTSSSSNTSGRIGRRRRKLRKRWKIFNRKRRMRVSRRGLGKKHRRAGNELVRPVLSYISKNGHVKVQRRISERDAEELMKKNVKKELRHKGFKVKTDTGQNKHGDLKPLDDHRNDQILLRRSGLEHVLENGKNSFSFRPAGDGKISNMSLSFNVS